MSGGRVLISLGAIGKDLPPLPINMPLGRPICNDRQIFPWSGVGNPDAPIYLPASNGRPRPIKPL